MLMEGQVKFFSPQNTAGVSQKNGVVVLSQCSECWMVVLKNVTDAMFLASLLPVAPQIGAMCVHTLSEACIGVGADQRELAISADLCFYMLPEIFASGRHQGTRHALQSILILLRALVGPLTPSGELHTMCALVMWMQLLSQELQAAANREGKNVALVTFFKTTWHCKTSEDLYYFRWAVRRPFMVLLCFLFQCLHPLSYLLGYAALRISHMIWCCTIGKTWPAMCLV